MFAPHVDSVVSQILPSKPEMLSNSQLERELQKSVDDNDFEKAVEIRDEIKRRKLADK